MIYLDQARFNFDLNRVLPAYPSALKARDLITLVWTSNNCNSLHGASPFPFPELIETELAGELGNFSCILSTTSYHRREEEKEEEKEGPTSISTKTAHPKSKPNNSRPKPKSTAKPKSTSAASTPHKPTTTIITATTTKRRAISATPRTGRNSALKKR
jgi:hypothetical protein